MSAKSAKRKSPVAKAAVAAATNGAAPEKKIDERELKAKVAFLNKILSKKPSDSDNKLVKKLREEMAAQNELQKKLQAISQEAQQIQNAIQAAGGRVNAVADLLWDDFTDGSSSDGDSEPSP